MPVAKFKLKDRVNVPGFPAQGVVSEVTISTKRPPLYAVDYLTHDGNHAVLVVSEADMLLSNPSAA